MFPKYHLAFTLHFTKSPNTIPNMTAAENELEGYDEEQVRLMEERCILVDENDKAYGEGSKKQCESTERGDRASEGETRAAG